MNGLADKRANKCEHVYTTPHPCVAAQTRLTRRASDLQELTATPGGLRIAHESF